MEVAVNYDEYLVDVVSDAVVPPGAATMLDFVTGAARHALVQKGGAAGFRVDRCSYADSLGFLAALAYRAVGNRSGDLNPRSVTVYDRFAFPLSRALDHVTGRLFGKNLALIATAEGAR